MGFFDFLKGKPKLRPEDLVVWVHRFEHLELVLASGAANGGDTTRLFDLAGVFGACIAVRTNGGLAPAGIKNLKRIGLDEDAAFEHAVTNVRALLQSREVKDGVYSWRLPGHVVGCAVMVAEALLDDVTLKGDLVMMYPEADLVLACGADDERALESMLDRAREAYDTSEEYRSLEAVSFDSEGEVDAWLPPEDHRLYARFLDASARSIERQARETYGALAEIIDKALAPLAVRDGLTASWFREANVVIPDLADTVALFDTEGAHARLEVPLDTLLDVLPGIAETVVVTLPGVDEESVLPFWAMNGSRFPTPREREHLVQVIDLDGKDGVEAREAPQAELLAAWDAGTPVLVQIRDAGLVLLHPDGRSAGVTLDALGDRLDALPTLDQLRIRAATASLALVAAAKKNPQDGLRLMQEAREALAELSERAANDHAQLMSSETAAELELTSLLDPPRLFPQVRPPNYADGTRANALGALATLSAGKPVELVEPARLTRPFAEGLSLELVSDAGDRVVTINRELLPTELHESVWNSALLNLEANSLKRWLPGGRKGVFTNPWRDDYDAVRVLLLPSLTNGLAVDGSPLVFAPTVGNVWVTGTNDVAGIGAVLDAIDGFLESGDATTPYLFRQLLHGWPWVVRDGTIARWAVPDGHRHGARFAALDARLAQKRADSVNHVGAFAQAVYGAGMTREARG